MRHFFVPPKSRCATVPCASSRSVMVTFCPLMITVRSPRRTRLHGTPHAASSRTALGAVLTNMRTTSWSAPQSEPRTVSSKCTSSLSPWPLITLPSDACIPPCAALLCERFGGTSERMRASCPRRFAAIAIRSPASPPPITSTSV